MTKPSKREMLKPLELLSIAAAFGIFAGLITLMSTRDFLLTVMFTGVAFIVGLVFLALFALTIKPNKIEQEEIHRDDDGNPKPPTML
ncbi:hypothetical protein [Paramicrobacterium agarici]|uniref:Uncharacterized protein n=1 Tax=Paramicrobacterium agarici TaxID=630514 RepID=A0A2A9DUD8_9MICO|nr:hypothetical protein [Microbacterium agarici]PFG30213.1 hypothetical protein ATJ78_1138 [Microbacterium agarici]TQO23221.1 hypothetical protein FB385_2067 [Microbacterium agarici]